MVAAATSRPEAGASSVPDALAHVAVALSALGDEPQALARLAGALEAAGVDCVVQPAPLGSDPVERLRSELAGMRVRSQPLFPLQQLRRPVVIAALRLMAQARRGSEVPVPREIQPPDGMPAATVELARDLCAMWCAEADCREEVAT